MPLCTPLTLLLWLVAMTRLSSTPDDNPQQVESIDTLMDQLTSIDNLDVGLSSTFSGSDFPPVAGQNHFGGGLGRR